MITVHRWIEREEWSAAEPITSAHVVVAIDPGACGAVVSMQRIDSSPVEWWTWDRGESPFRRFAFTTEHSRPVVLVEEPVSAGFGASSIQQGWDAAWVAQEIARACGARDVVRVNASTWQAAVLGANVDRVMGADGKTKRLPRGEARKARKAAAVAQLPREMAESVKSKARREALADAYGLARWGLLLEAQKGRAA